MKHECSENLVETNLFYKDKEGKKYTILSCLVCNTFYIQEKKYLYAKVKLNKDKWVLCRDMIEEGTRPRLWTDGFGDDIFFDDIFLDDILNHYDDDDDDDTYNW